MTEACTTARMNHRLGSNRMRARIAIAGFALLVAANEAGAIAASPLDPDPTYGTQSRVTLAAGPAGSAMGPALVQSDGRLVVSGIRVITRNNNGRGRQELFLRRYLPDGSPDSAFGANGETRISVRGSDTIHQITQQPDGKIVLAIEADEPCNAVFIGICLNDAGQNAALNSALARLRTDGTLDPAFGNAGIVETADFFGAYGVALQPDGKLLLLGTTSIARAQIFNWRLARFNSDGTRDPAFNGGQTVGSTCASQGFALVLQADGRIVVGGDQGLFYADPAVNPGFCLERRQADGAPDPSFGATWTSFGVNVSLTGIVIVPGGRLLAVGRGIGRDGTDAQRTTSGAVAAQYESNGILSAGYGTGGKWFVPVSEYFAWTGFTFARDGGIVVAGYDFSPPPDGMPQQFRDAFAKVDAGGHADPSFGPNGVTFRNPGGDVLAAFLRDVEDHWLLVSTQALADGSAGGLIERLRGERPEPVAVIEFFNVDLGHYFITASASEAAGIDAGAAGPGWQRTGYNFLAWQPTAFGIASATLYGVPQLAHPLCRFYGTPGIGPNSHFYTIDDAECAQVRTDPGWLFENLPFYAFRPQPGANATNCPGELQPVWRAYNNRFAQNDSNHRYTTNPAIYQQMKSQGWTGEGIVFCAAPG